jgi:hypothetical protein
VISRRHEVVDTAKHLVDAERTASGPDRWTSRTRPLALASRDRASRGPGLYGSASRPGLTDGAGPGEARQWHRRQSTHLVPHACSVQGFPEEQNAR